MQLEPYIGSTWPSGSPQSQATSSTTSFPLFSITATLVYKFLHTGNPKYFDSSLRLHKYNTRHGQPNSLFLEVLKFVPSVFSSEKQFGLRFSFDAPTLWNDLPHDIRHSPSVASKTEILPLL